MKNRLSSFRCGILVALLAGLFVGCADSNAPQDFHGFSTSLWVKDTTRVHAHMRMGLDRFQGYLAGEDSVITEALVLTADRSSYVDVDVIALNAYALSRLSVGTYMAGIPHSSVLSDSLTWLIEGYLDSSLTVVQAKPTELRFSSWGLVDTISRSVGATRSYHGMEPGGTIYVDISKVLNYPPENQEWVGTTWQQQDDGQVVIEPDVLALAEHGKTYILSITRVGYDRTNYKGLWVGAEAIVSVSAPFVLVE